MRVHELKNLKRQTGIIFEVISLTTTKVTRYGKPYGVYVEEKVIQENVVLQDYVNPRGRKPSIKTLVRRAAQDVCPGEEVVFFENMIP